MPAHPGDLGKEFKNNRGSERPRKQLLALLLKMVGCVGFMSEGDKSIDLLFCKKVTCRSASHRYMYRAKSYPEASSVVCVKQITGVVHIVCLHLVHLRLVYNPVQE